MLGTLCSYFVLYCRDVEPVADLYRHYVAFIRKSVPGDNEDAWVLFNDEKVVKAVDVDEMKKFAYVYFFQRL